MTHASRQSVAPALSPNSEHSSAGNSRWDNLEREADRAADQALAVSESEVGSVSRVHLSQNTLGPGDYEPLSESVQRTLVTPGAPLERGLRMDMERRLGHDFSHVRVHADSAGADSARQIDAQAYTVGNHIVFGTGHFAPTTHSGRHLIAHELAHVVQQSSKGAAAGNAGVVQRKPLRDPVGNESSPPLLERPDPGPIVFDQPSQSPPANISVPYAAPKPMAAQPPINGGPVPQVNPLASPAAAGEGASATAPAVSPAETGESEMPRLTDRFTDPVATTGDSTPREGNFEADKVDLAELFRALAFGARESRKTVESYARDARAHVDRSADAAIKKAGDHAKDAEDAMIAKAGTRHKQVDQLVDAHESQLAWQVKQCKERAGEYAANAKQAYTDGFDLYRGELAGVFNVWGRRFEKLDKDEGTRIKETMTGFRSTALDYAGNYDIIYIRSNTSQSAGRAEVQRDAATEVAMDFIENANKVEPPITTSLSEITSNLIRQVWKQRDDALEKYKEGLQPVLKGVDDQLAAARVDIDVKRMKVGVKLTKVRAALHARLDLLEHDATKRNAEFESQVKSEIDKARSGADKRILRAAPTAMKPIGDVVNDAVGLLASRKEELDPAAARQFVGEVVQFSVDAAEGTRAIFAGARNTGVSSLASAGPLAKLRFAQRFASFRQQLNEEGAQKEFEMIEFSGNADDFLAATLTDLDGSYHEGIVRAAAALTKIVVDTRDTIYDPLEQARKDVITSVNQGLGQISDEKWKLLKEIPKAARHAAWVYDHPVRDRIVRGADIFLGVLAAVLVFAALVVALPFILGAEAALVVVCLIAFVSGFAMGYYGVQAYKERRKAGDSAASAFFGAVADVTGLTDFRRSFTDQKMPDFERGFAIGNFFIALFGAKEGVGRFYKSAKLRFPKLFTNPFRPKLPPIPLEPPVAAVGGMAVDLPKPGLPDNLNIPHEGVPGAEATDRPPAPPSDAPGFKPPHEEIPGPDTSARFPEPAPDGPAFPQADEQLPQSDTSTKAPEPQPKQQPTPDTSGEAPAPKPGRVGFELPYEKVSPAKARGATGTPDTNVDSPRLHHRNKPTAPETTPPAPKGPIGFRPPEKSPPAATPRPETPGPAGEASPPAGGVSQMPPAREIPGAGPRAGNAQAPATRPATTMSSTRAMPHPEAGAHGGPAPTKGTAVSNVEPEGAGAAARQDVGPAQFDAELADELAVREARSRRIAAEDTAAKVHREVAEIEQINKELGPRPERDHIHDELQKHKAALEEAKKEVADAKRAEIEAEAAERIGLKRRRDLDPAAAKHDTELRQHAEEEYGRRMERVGELDEFMKENEPAVAAAKDEVARKQKAFDKAEPGEAWDPNTKSKFNVRERARNQLNQAEHDLARAEGRNSDALKAKEKQLERMQDLDRAISPDDYPDLTADKGVYGEKRGRADLNEKGYKFKGSSKEPALGKPKDQGLDGVFENETPPPDEPKHVVAEMKYDTSEPTPGQKKTEWVDDNLETTVGPDHANKMRREGYEYWVVKYDPVTGRVRPPKKMWAWEPNGKIGPGKRVLGDAHPISPD
ncbi:MAG: hypothetical protein JWQ90_2999 [Hydrocarboniphaga sp.]|uniref:eCIS core domain-containing protein n=1 Tax=Hydrocarboniphaga sp. TaxID=2033016 RepID=UPI00262F8CE2|nr:DUF4157 domain-containing protein [Hydrocarboniphaga sp.]MDB5970549.1 hypothetical protein [Hydrocarboniphaga sp.]